MEYIERNPITNCLTFDHVKLTQGNTVHVRRKGFSVGCHFDLKCKAGALSIATVILYVFYKILLSSRRYCSHERIQNRSANSSFSFLIFNNMEVEKPRGPTCSSACPV